MSDQTPARRTFTARRLPHAPCHAMPCHTRVGAAQCPVQNAGFAPTHRAWGWSARTGRAAGEARTGAPTPCLEYRRCACQTAPRGLTPPRPHQQRGGLAGSLGCSGETGRHASLGRTTEPQPHGRGGSGVVAALGPRKWRGWCSLVHCQCKQSNPLLVRWPLVVSTFNPT